jgi:hypothetical protein
LYESYYNYNFLFLSKIYNNLKKRWITQNSNMTSFFRFVDKRAIYRLEYKYGSILWLEDGDLYLRLQKMSHTIYVSKFEQTIIHQHVHLRRKSQSHLPAHVLMRLYPIDKSLVCLKSKHILASMIYFSHELVRRTLCKTHYE